MKFKNLFAGIGIATTAIGAIGVAALTYDEITRRINNRRWKANQAARDEEIKRHARSLADTWPRPNFGLVKDVEEL